MTDETGAPFFFYGGRKQLDKRVAEAAPSVGDRVAIRRLEDARAEPGMNGAWRVRVAVRPGDGTAPPQGVEDVAVEAADDAIPF
jgi:hypothetical protein